MPPRSKNGSTISSQVSLRTRDGGGSVAPALRHSSSQIASSSAITTIGGTTRAATLDAYPSTRSMIGGRFGVPSVSTFAPMRVEGSGTAVSDFLRGIFIKDAFRSRRSW